MWHDYWFGNDPEVKVMLDNMALLRQLLDLKDAWAIMPATLGHKLAENETAGSFLLKTVRSIVHAMQL